MRILFSLVAGWGHLRPLLPIASALRDEGHEVAFVTSDRFAYALEQRGHALFAADEPPWDDRFDSMSEEEALAYVASWFGRESPEALLQPMRRAIDEWSPDVLVRETSEFAGWMASDLYGLPLVTFEFATGIPEDEFALMRTHLDPLRAGLGLPMSGFSIESDLHVFAAPPGWIERLPARSLLIRPASDDAAGQPAWEHTRRGHVVATLGTEFNRDVALFQAIADAIGQCGRAGVVAVGDGVDVAELSPPADVEVVQYAPMSHALAGAAAIIAHAGYGTTMTALSAGVPIVSLPMAPTDNWPTARRIQDLGVGVALDEQARTSEDLAAALRTVLIDDRFRRNAGLVADNISRLPGPEATVAAIESLSRRRK